MTELKTINILAYGHVHRFWLDVELAQEQAASLGAGFEARAVLSHEDMWYVAPQGTIVGAVDAAGRPIPETYFVGNERSAYYAEIAREYIEKNDDVFKVHCAIWHSVDPLGVGPDVPEDEYRMWAAVTREMCEKKLSIEDMAAGIQRIYRDWQWADEKVSLERATALAETFAVHREQL
jgi:hypothetical protein